MESPSRRRIEGTARVPFMWTLPEEEWEVHHNDTESRTGCNMDRFAFMEEVWTVVLQDPVNFEKGLNRPLMREILDKLDESEGKLSDFLIDSGTDESEVNSLSKPTQQEGGNGVVYLSRTRKRTIRSKMVIDKVTLRKTGKTKVDSEISVKAFNSAK